MWVMFDIRYNISNNSNIISFNIYDLYWKPLILFNKGIRLPKEEKSNMKVLNFTTAFILWRSRLKFNHTYNFINFQVLATVPRAANFKEIVSPLITPHILCQFQCHHISPQLGVVQVGLQLVCVWSFRKPTSRGKT